MAFEFHLPDLAEGMAEAEIVSWKIKEGDKVELDQPIVEVMSDKATVEIPAPRAGTVTKLHFGEGDVAPVGAVLFTIEEDGGAAKAAPASAPAPKAAPVPTMTASTPGPVVIDASAGRARVLATPATRRIARQLSVDLSQVQATGKNGRVTTDDVRRHANGGGGPALYAVGGSAQAAVAPAPAPAPVAPLSLPRGAHEERVPFRGMRRKIAENMQRSAFTATHFTYVEEVDVTELVAVRQRARARADERGIKLTYLPFIMKAVVAGLRRYPQLNAALDEQAQEIVRKGYFHLGVAAQGPQGLMVTVVRNADQLSIFALAAEVARLSQAVQEGKASKEELTGSTFTISSLGKLGGLHATPIINHPEVGILGVHKIEQRPAVVDGEIVPRWRMNLSISLDHRLVDGWDGAMFLAEVKALLEDPTTMFMEMV